MYVTQDCFTEISTKISIFSLSFHQIWSPNFSLLWEQYKELWEQYKELCEQLFS